ncbi:MAG: hypothetical protein AVDCRST_MAG68-50, partial [uncultured Gemmatimonadetes bacterium]
ARPAGALLPLRRGRGALAGVAAALPLGPLPAPGRLRHGAGGDGGPARLRPPPLARLVGVGDDRGRDAPRGPLPPRGRHHHGDGRGVELPPAPRRHHPRPHRPRLGNRPPLAPPRPRAANGRRRGHRPGLHPPRSFAHPGRDQAGRRTAVSHRGTETRRV